MTEIQKPSLMIGIEPNVVQTLNFDLEMLKSEHNTSPNPLWPFENPLFQLES